ncbi:hypothetical protein SIAM614_00387 [Stappia aggregata IAM 12614]|uniref:Uncharacterized protein n=1 Tax=Roseibium aggregatum (strain ATCC 25650 / DSM 13394 / JCM 20685 / NBRC 16684 / NCIMB 2208 / IAM 12614 / B1) TaxID=384765 RepID=A0P2K0_ROSAI|nr:hypothetical protein [Roseibium aggregatum]EAV40653.1 hypothetical protein SIAM614_00387 [Stappia aggregata IAM 12614] [Roseibium aggregatum IAM 12614]
MTDSPLKSLNTGPLLDFTNASLARNRGEKTSGGKLVSGNVYVKKGEVLAQMPKATLAGRIVRWIRDVFTNNSNIKAQTAFRKALVDKFGDAGREAYNGSCASMGPRKRLTAQQIKIGISQASKTRPITREAAIEQNRKFCEFILANPEILGKKGMFRMPGQKEHVRLLQEFSEVVKFDKMVKRGSTRSEEVKDYTFEGPNLKGVNFQDISSAFKENIRLGVTVEESEKYAKNVVDFELGNQELMNALKKEDAKATKDRAKGVISKVSPEERPKVRPETLPAIKELPTAFRETLEVISRFRQAQGNADLIPSNSVGMLFSLSCDETGDYYASALSADDRFSNEDKKNGPGNFQFASAAFVNAMLDKYDEEKAGAGSSGGKSEVNLAILPAKQVDVETGTKRWAAPRGKFASPVAVSPKKSEQLDLDNDVSRWAAPRGKFASPVAVSSKKSEQSDLDNDAGRSSGAGSSVGVPNHVFNVLTSKAYRDEREEQLEIAKESPLLKVVDEPSRTGTTSDV